MTWVRWFSFRKRTPRHLIATHAPCCKIMDTSIAYLGKAECRGSLGSSLGGEKIIFVMVYVHMLCLHMRNAWSMCIINATHEKCMVYVHEICLHMMNECSHV